MEKILVSACLLGAKVRYHGGDANCDDPILRDWMNEGRLVAVCPEQEGGLPTPRPPVEIVGAGGGRGVIARDGFVRTAAGHDVTASLCQGADRALDLVKQHHIRIAVLKNGSPSCGSSVIFDGRFSGTRVAGAGVTTALLEAHGVRVFNEGELATARDWLERVETTEITETTER
jgi:uncharacterized protein YbbK (DUF523 family)